MPAKATMVVTADASAQAAAGAGSTVGYRAHTVRHEQGKTARTGRLETEVVGTTGRIIDDQYGTAEHGHVHNRRDFQANPICAAVVHQWDGRDYRPGGQMVFLTNAFARFCPFWTAHNWCGKRSDLCHPRRSSMLTLPKEFVTLMNTFAPLFTKRGWQPAQRLVVGAIRAPGKRTVTAALRVMGLAQAKSLQQYHRVLNREVWSGREGARLWLLLLGSLLAPTGPLIMGLDDTVERRRGAKIRAQGMYRDPVRSSHRHMVKARG